MFPFSVVENRFYKPCYPIMASRGIVGTSQHLASQAGLSMLQRGGNAIDAAIAAAIALTVVEPTSNGIGGDAFAIVLFNGNLYGLNSSGYAPETLSLEFFRRSGLKEIPQWGAIPVTVPGAPSAWRALHDRFGKLSFETLFEPAVEYAGKGFPVSAITAQSWALAFSFYKNGSEERVLRGEVHAPRQDATMFSEWFEIFAPAGRAPVAGEIWRSKAHAQTLVEIAQSKADSFYHGNLAEKIVNYLQKKGGFLQIKDLETYSPLWVDPIQVDFQGYSIWEIPPNGQGLIALIALGILENLPLVEFSEVDRIHHSIEAIKLAFEIGLEVIADARWMKTESTSFLEKEKLRTLAKSIDAQKASAGPAYSKPGGTVYLATADSQGNMVSYIQSNYKGFGSGLVVPGTGIALHNRGCNFSLEESHPNCLQGGKRPYHTIIPGFLSQGKRWIGPFGVMGGFMQPQGHLQVLTHLLLDHLNPQDSLNFPRWQWIQGREIVFEQPVSEKIIAQLAEKGHLIEQKPSTGFFGRGQILWRDESGVYCGGSDGRADGCIAAF